MRDLDLAGVVGGVPGGAQLGARGTGTGTIDDRARIALKSVHTLTLTQGFDTQSVTQPSGNTTSLEQNAAVVFHAQVTQIDPRRARFAIANGDRVVVIAAAP